MNFCKRIIILTDKQDSEKKGVLSCEQTGETLKCSLKTFGINVDDSAVLAIKLDSVMLSPLNILKKTLTQFEFALNNNLNLGAPMSVVLATKKDTEITTLLSGGEENEHEQIESYLKARQNLGKLVLEKEIKIIEPEIALFEQDEEHVEQIIDEQVEQIIDEELKSRSFFDSVQEQIEQMFVTFPKCDTLSDIIENSKWINVDYDGRGTHYCFGLIFDEITKEHPKYICYAVPSTGNKKPPQSVADFCQWLPLDKTLPDGDGYYIMFQDAQSGESVAM